MGASAWGTSAIDGVLGLVGNPPPAVPGSCRMTGVAKSYAMDAAVSTNSGIVPMSCHFEGFLVRVSFGHMSPCEGRRSFCLASKDRVPLQDS
jgi:hypothetical protein